MIAYAVRHPHQALQQVGGYPGGIGSTADQEKDDANDPNLTKASAALRHGPIALRARSRPPSAYLPQWRATMTRRSGGITSPSMR